MASHVKSVIQECRQLAGRHLENMWSADNLLDAIWKTCGAPITCGNGFVKKMACRQLAERICEKFGIPTTVFPLYVFKMVSQRFCRPCSMTFTSLNRAGRDWASSFKENIAVWKSDSNILIKKVSFGNAYFIKSIERLIKRLSSAPLRSPL